MKSLALAIALLACQSIAQAPTADRAAAAWNAFVSMANDWTTRRNTHDSGTLDVRELALWHEVVAQWAKARRAVDADYKGASNGSGHAQ